MPQPVSDMQSKVVLAAVKGEQTLSALTERFEVHPTQITPWKAELLKCAAKVCARAGEKRARPSCSRSRTLVCYLAQPMSQVDLG